MPRSRSSGLLSTFTSAMVITPLYGCLLTNLRPGTGVGQFTTVPTAQSLTARASPQHGCIRDHPRDFIGPGDEHCVAGRYRYGAGADALRHPPLGFRQDHAVVFTDNVPGRLRLPSRFRDPVAKNSSCDWLLNGSHHASLDAVDVGCE